MNFKNIFAKANAAVKRNLPILAGITAGTVVAVAAYSRSKYELNNDDSSYIYSFGPNFIWKV